MGNFEEIKINSKDTFAVIVPERGGIVTKFEVLGKDILYCDQSTVEDPGKNIRGGIPVLFPQAGPLNEGSKYPLKQHGFARNMAWEVVEEEQSLVLLQLLSSDETRSVFPFDFKLTERVEVKDKTLLHQVSIENIGSEKMPTAFGTHPYFFIPDAEKENLKTTISGFEGPFKKGESFFDWGVEQTLKFANPGEFEVLLKDRVIKIKTDKNKLKHLMIWWQVDKDFVCFEPWVGDNGILLDNSKCQWINPGETISYELIVSAEVG